eukprot:2204989-Pyramimonas_sp.AAC.1
MAVTNTPKKQLKRRKQRNTTDAAKPEHKQLRGKAVATPTPETTPPEAYCHTKSAARPCG